jgi:hypothetical protein
MREQRRLTPAALAKRAKVAQRDIADLEGQRPVQPWDRGPEAPRESSRRPGHGSPRMARRPVARKPLKRAAGWREPERVTTNQIMAWLAERLAQDPQLRRSIERVLTALQRAEAAGVARRRRAR